MDVRTPERAANEAACHSKPMGSSGSYHADDVTILMKQVSDVVSTEIERKEAQIQSGHRHYSEMITKEELPPLDYIRIFEQATIRSARRMAMDVVTLAESILLEATTTPTIVSLARAGTPIGVLLNRTIRLLSGQSDHYSISIIRDRGIDDRALGYILERHPPESLFFVDGWIGKGAIATELKETLQRFHAKRGIQLRDGLYVISDLAGVSNIASTHEDYLIPSSILNAIVSGLISRSILNDHLVGPNDFHACLYYAEYQKHDRSMWFVDVMTQAIKNVLCSSARPAIPSQRQREKQKQMSNEFIGRACDRYQLRDPHRVKPGIGESTRAILRRVPDRLLVADPSDEEVQHLVWLADQKRVPIETATWIPYKAAVIIRTLGKD